MAEERRGREEEESVWGAAGACSHSCAGEMGRNEVEQPFS